MLCDCKSCQEIRRRRQVDDGSVALSQGGKALPLPTAVSPIGEPEFERLGSDARRSVGAESSELVRDCAAAVSLVADDFHAALLLVFQKQKRVDEWAKLEADNAPNLGKSMARMHHEIMLAAAIDELEHQIEKLIDRRIQRSEAENARPSGTHRTTPDAVTPTIAEAAIPLPAASARSAPCGSYYFGGSL